jgi:hypothetical protein
VTKTDSTSNIVTVMPSSGTIGGAGASSFQLSLQDMEVELWYDPSTTTWWIS